MTCSLVHSTITDAMFCHYCGQGFKRDEHLARHVLTHTNVRPFRCRECKLTFKRKDLLRRHYQCIHTSSTEQSNARNDENAGPTGSGMARIPIACVNCAQSKTKCDNQIPCTRCVKKDITCERRKFRRSSFKIPPKQSRSDKVIPYEHFDEGIEISNSDEVEQPEEFEGSHATSEEPLITTATLRRGNPSRTALVSLEEDPCTMGSGTDMSAGLGLSINTSFPFYASVQQTFQDDMDFSIAGMEYHVSHLLESEPFFLPKSIDSAFPDSDWSCIERESHVLASAEQTSVIKPSPGTDIHSQWPQFRCNPTAKEDRNTPIQNLANLKVLERPDIWSLSTQDPNTHTTLAVAEGSPELQACEPSTRDKLFAVIQQMWRIAKDQMAYEVPTENNNDATNAWMDSVILLPPTDVMHQFLGRYVSLVYQQFHLLPEPTFTTSASILETENQLLAGVNALEIIAQVTRNGAAAEVRALSSGLVDICRLVVQDVEWAVDAEFLESSLSLVQLLQWSGDACHMTSAIELWDQHAKQIQRSTSNKRLRRDSMVAEGQASESEVDTKTPSSETQSRMLCSWMAVDLELSLFHDVTPKLAMRDLTSSALSSLSSDRHFTSFTDLFEAFLEGKLSGPTGIAAPGLRLLLHPLQCLSAHLHQCLSTFGSVQDSGKGPNPTLGLASKAFIDEMSTLLERWHALVFTTTSASDMCPISKGSLVLYHIMILNNLASFPDVERLIRENKSGTWTPNDMTSSWMRTAAPGTRARMLFHCGQCVFHLRTLSPTARPLWWAASLYRVTLLLCQVIMLASMSNAAYPAAASSFQFSTSLESPISTHALITLDREDNSNRDTQASLEKFHGTPALTRSDGTTLILATAIDVLDYSIGMLVEHLLFEPTEFSNGILGKLSALRARWFEGQGLQTA